MEWVHIEVTNNEGAFYWGLTRIHRRSKNWDGHDGSVASWLAGASNENRRRRYFDDIPTHVMQYGNTLPVVFPNGATKDMSLNSSIMDDQMVESEKPAPCSWHVLRPQHALHPQIMQLN